MNDHRHEEPHDHDGGLATDLPKLLSRRRALQVMGLGSLAVLAGCAGATSLSGTGGSSSAATSTEAEASSGSSDVAEIPEETAGPYPGDGSNGVNVLTESGIVRSDITASFGGGSGVAEGVPLSIDLTVLDVAAGGTPVEGAAVYIWHCDREGRYSLYSDEILDENYLRGLQPADANGKLAFTSIFPGAYSGRWPHIHFEVYPSLEAAADEANRIATSQIALPESTSAEVYATDGYEQSVTALASLSLATDGVFGEDGGARQLGTISGSPTTGLTVELAVPVRVG
jgi:protocatechuate 3,4-dioxygenase beta subunit